MKKAIIYLLLSVLLVVPVAAMVSVAVMSRQKNYYSEEKYYDGDYSAVSTDAISGERIEEILMSTGVFTSDEEMTVKFDRSAWNTVLVLVREGDYVQAGSALCTIDNQEKLCETNAKVDRIVETEKAIVFFLHATKPKVLRVYLPTELYGYADKSSISFSWAGKEHDGLTCLSKKSVAEEGGNRFCVDYSLPKGKYPYLGSVNVTVKTGRVVADALTVPKRCLFQESDGRFYLELFDEGSISKAYVNLGMQGDKLVEIVPDGADDLHVGTVIVVNNVDVFAKTGG